jgi:hypothetical protein
MTGLDAGGLAFTFAFCTDVFLLGVGLALDFTFGDAIGGEVAVEAILFVGVGATCGGVRAEGTLSPDGFLFVLRAGGTEPEGVRLTEAGGACGGIEMAPLG